MQFQPDLRPFPADFLTWADNLSPGRFAVVGKPGRAFVFGLTDPAPRTAGFGHRVPISSTFFIYASDVLNSVNWRRLMAARIRALRFANLRLSNPRAVLGRQAPHLPWPR